MPIDGGLRLAGARMARGAMAGQRGRALRRWAAALLLLPTLAVAADPQIAELTDAPDPVAAGGVYRYTVRVDNNAPDAATNTRLRFTVPSGASFLGAEPASQNCVATSATQIDCSLGTLGGNGADPRTLVLTWRATVAGLATIQATAEVSADPAVNPANADNPDNNVQRQTTTVTSGANLSLTMSGTPASVVAGARVVYTLAVANAGPNVSGDINLTAELSPSTQYFAASGSGWTCTGNYPSTTVQCRHPGQHAVGQALPLLYMEAVVYAASGTITSSASVLPAAVGGTPDPELGNNVATVDTAVVAGADVKVSGLAVLTGDPAVAGSTVRFLISPRNGGPSTANGVTLTQTLPAGWTLVSASGPAWTCGVAGLTATCTRASYPKDAAEDITLVATAPGTAEVGPTGTTYSFAADISSTTADADLTNNRRETSLRVLPSGADLSLSKSKSPSPVALGGQLTSRLLLTNGGPQRATGPLRVVDQLAAGESHVGFSGAGWSCTAAGRTVTCEHANSAGLAVGASLPELLITSRADAAGALSNQACTGNSLPGGALGVSARPPVEGDPNPGNDCASASALSTSVRPDLAISKVSSTPNGDKLLSASEDAVTYTLVVRNASLTAEAATGIVITDNLPAFLASRSLVRQPVLASVSGGSARFSCSVSAALVTCTQTAGALQQGESVSVPITVERPLAEGSFTNTAEVRNTVEGDPNSGNNSASDSITIAGIADVAMTGKTVAPGSVRAGENASYVLSFRNNGPSVASGVVVNDGFDFAVGDAGLTVISIASSAAGSSCDIAAGAVLKPGNSSFSCAIGSLADGQTESITLVVRPNWQAGNAARSVANTASIRTTTVESPSGGDNGNNRRSATLAIAPAELDLLVNTTDLIDPVPYAAGSTFLDYRVRITSNGPSFGTGVQFSELMTPERTRRVRFVCDTVSLGSNTCNPTPLCSVANVTSATGVAIPAFSCRVPAGDSSTGTNIGELASGQSKDVFLRFQVLDQPSGLGDVYDTVATASANEPDSFSANNTEGERTTTRQRIDLRVSKSASLPTVSLRQPFNWVIQVDNRGPGNSLRTDLSDTLPAGTELTGPITFSRTLPAGTGNCSATGLVVSCSLGQLDGGGVATVTVPVRIVSYPASGRLSNRATVDNDPAKTGAIDIPGGNNSGEGEVLVTRASIAGLVFEDRDRSAGNGGVPQDAAAEPRVAGVALRLTGTDAYGNPVDLTTRTDASGAYAFTDLSPASAAGYTLTETQPAGYLNGPVAPPTSGANAPSAGGSHAAGGTAGDSVYSAVLLPADTAAVRYNFPELRQPGLSGFVYIDSNNNGRRDSASDAPIGGATVRLLDAATGVVLASTSTDASGAYQFSLLDPSRRYTLEQPLPGVPAGLLNGPVNPGLVGGVACASGCTAQPDTPAVGTDRIADIGLAAGDDGTQFNFGERQSAALSGTVYIDRNRDGAMDPAPADGRLPGVLVSLYPGSSCSGSALASSRTDANGNFSFSGLSVGATYTLCETQPAGFGDGGVNPGVGGSSSAPNSITIAALPAAGVGDNRFGELLGALAGAVYADISPATPALTDNGVRDAGEPGLVGVTVTLVGRDIGGQSVSRSTSTDANGNYLFDDLLQSDAAGYTVREGAIPASAGQFNDGREAVGSVGGNLSVNDDISAVLLPAGVRASGYNFGELPVAAISGTVYIDRNRDGAPDPAPADGRLPGVLISLYPGSSCSGSALASTRTDAAGNFSFSGLSAGLTYTVCETQPAGYGEGSVNPGASGSSVAPNTISIASLPAGGATGLAFGEQVASLAGAVYVDSSPATPANTNNGLRDSGEAGVAGVVLSLSGSDASGAAVNRSATTDTSGNYRFDDLLASDARGYTLVEGAIPAAAGALVDGRDSAGSAGGSTAVNDQISAVVLGAGVQASGYNFGELPVPPVAPVAEISGTVFIDRNRDGAMDPTPTDARLPGVLLTLYPGSSCSGTPLASTRTDADGRFSFAGLPVGASYTLCETQPGGYGDGPVNPGNGGGSAVPNTISITSLPAGGSAGHQFGERVASLAGAVYVDSSPATPANTDNGQREPGEAGITGVSITLSGTDALGAAVNRSTSTDASGNYRFDDLLASGAAGYTVVEGAIPAAAGSFNDGRDTAGSAGGSTAVNDQTSAIVLGAGVQATGYNFGELPATTISGTVYIDRNRDGGMDPTPTDGRLPGVLVTLYPGTSCSGTPIGSTRTDAAGNFSFGGVSAGGTYTVCETQPVGVGEGNVNPGANGSSGAPNAITITNLPAGGSAGHQFGERLGSLAGNVYLDANHDGQRQAAEAGIGGVTVTLSGVDASGAAVNRSTSTDASGAYRFDDLLAAGGSGYSLSEQAAQPVVGGVTTLDGRSTAGTVAGLGLGTASAPTSLPSRISSVLLPAGANGVAYNFGEILPSSVSGVVYIDTDGDGRQSGASDTGLPGVTIVLSGTDDTGAPVSITVTTGPDGGYTVPGLRPGNYVLTEPTQPAGTSEGSTSAGSAGGVVTPPGPALPSSVTGIVIGSPNTPATGYNFGELPANAAIAGLVWLDANNNGAVDSAEAGIAGVVVTLSGTDVLGRAVNLSTRTDASGAYRFDQLLPGRYTLTEPSQPSGTLNGQTLAGPAGGTPSAVASTPSAISGIALAAGQVATANHFGEIPPASASGQVFIDANGNGNPDTGEAGLPGVTVVLSGTNDLGQPVSISLSTGPDGSYSFPNLRPGTYTLTEPTQPAGTVNGITTPGPLGGSATPVGSTPSVVSGIVLPAGGQASGNNFAEQGQSPDLRVAESHSPATLTVGGSASYPISVRNAGDLPTSGSYSVDGRLPAGLTLSATPAGNGWVCTGAAGASSFSCSSSTVLVPGAVHPGAITVPVAVGAAALPGSPVSAWVMVDGGGESDARRPTADERSQFNSNPAALPVCLPAIVHNACREPAPVQAPAAVSGTVWFDRGTATRLLDAGDTRLAGWGVEVLDVATGQVIARATTGADGSYRVDSLQPGVALAVRFRDPASGVVFGYPVNGETAVGASGASCVSGTPPAGTPSSCVVAGASPQLLVVLAAGQLLPQQSLPVDPSGVVYDAVQRTPVSGASVALAPVGNCAGWDPATAVVGATLGGYTVSGSSIAMTVGSNGFYQFQLAPAAPASCSFGLTVTPPSGYQSPSTLIPANAGPLVPPGAAGSVYSVQPQADAPTGAVGTATTYYLTLTTGSAGVSVVHNHIPLDPALPSSLSLRKTGDKARAEVGDSVRYTVTVTLGAGSRPVQTTVVDRLPAGFSFIAGTASVNGVAIADPSGGVGPTLAFNLGPAPASGSLVLQYRVRVGVGAQQGDGINRAQAHSCSAPASCVGAGFAPVGGAVASNEGRFQVAVGGGVLGDQACVLGKVFVDCNGNHVQDREELGIPGVRLVMSDGTTLISDSEGKYSACGISPRSHVLRIDPLTLPRGARLTTSSNRNLGDAGSLWLDLKNGELHRADFIEGSCSNTVLEQTKARRAQGEVRAPETERRDGPALRFDSKAHGLDTLRSPQQGTDGANQQAPQARQPAEPPPAPARTQDAQNLPTSELTMNRPPPTGRQAGTAPDAAAQGGSDGTR